MKKWMTLFAVAAFFSYCSSTKQVATPTAPVVSFTNNVHPLIQSNCAPCHIAGQGKAKPLNNYAAAKDEIGEMISRVKRAPNDKGFMPMRHDKLPDSTIAVLERWRQGGLVE